MEHKKVLQLMIANLLNQNNVIVDTETTGLKYNDEIIEISIIDVWGEVLLDTLVKPTRSIPAEATAINHITNEMVADAPAWRDVYPTVMEIIGQRKWIAWNSKFDARLITQTCLITGIYEGLSQAQLLAEYERVHGNQIDAKPIYSAWVGALNDKGDGFVRQRLSDAANQMGLSFVGGAHRSLSDSQMVLRVLLRASNKADVSVRQLNELAPCPFCYGPPSLFVRYLDKNQLQYKPLYTPVNYEEEGLQIGAYVFCHECGAQGEEVGAIAYDDADVVQLEDEAKRTWNQRDQRHKSLFAANSKPAKFEG